MAFWRPLAILFYGDHLFFFFPPLACAPHWRRQQQYPGKQRELFGDAVEEERFPWKFHILRDTQCFIAVEHELKKEKQNTLCAPVITHYIVQTQRGRLLLPNICEGFFTAV